MAKVRGTTRTTRERTMKCADCGYRGLFTRRWLAVAIPRCPNPACANHGGELSFQDEADAIELGLLDPATLPAARYNDIARRQGWELILNQGQAVQAERRRYVALGRSAAPATEVPF